MPNPIKPASLSPDADPRRFLAEPLVKGLDVSEHQPDLPWDKLFEAGYRFCYARVADGSTHIDAPQKGEPPSRAHYAEHRDGARAAGMKTGAYLFVRCGDRKKMDEQAALLLSQLDNTDLPPCLDCEERTDLGLPLGQVRESITYLVEQVKKYAGRVLVYTAIGWWDRFMLNTPTLDADLWVANYKVKTPAIPSTWKRQGATIWQYTGEGTFPGVKGYLDMNLFRGSEAELDAWAQGVCLATAITEPPPA